MSATYWLGQLDCTERGPRPNLANAVRVIDKDPTLGPDILWYDEFRDRVMVARGHPPRPWTPEDDYRLTVYMQDKEIGISLLQDSIVKKAVLMRAKSRTRHCVRDYLLALQWDGVPRLAHALEDHWGVECSPRQPVDYVRAVSANLFRGLVARILVPGCKLDEMVVFEGRTGAKKSMALEVLGGEWHGVAHTRVTEKDFFQDLQGKWIMVVEELDSFSKAQVERIKTVITTRRDTFRGSYDPRSTDHARQCALAGTTNRDDWGHDETGLRRFMPIVVGNITPDSLTAARDQLFAEAITCHLAGCPWWIYPETAAEVQALRQDYDEWTSLIVPWAQLQILGGATHITVGAALAGAVKIEASKVDKVAQMRAGRILALSGWTRSLNRVNGIPMRIWFPPVTTDTTLMV